MAAPPFEKSVFINCPFDEDYAPILEAIGFCVIYFDFHPRIATERADSTENRLDKIRELIESSKYSIHDLSRSQATRKGEYYRLNMPFELGIDYACKKFCCDGRQDKKILILEEESYRYRISLSDLSGCDISIHGGDYQKAVSKVRHWLVNEAGAIPKSPTVVLNNYVDFQEWNFERLEKQGYSEADIFDLPTKERLSAMQLWKQQQEHE